MCIYIYIYIRIHIHIISLSLSIYLSLSLSLSPSWYPPLSFSRRPYKMVRVRNTYTFMNACMYALEARVVGCVDA